MRNTQHIVLDMCDAVKIPEEHYR